jgi:hypothetical protein
MTVSIKTAIENVKEINTSDAALSTLLDIERVIDNLDIYVFKHWKLGELVEGPIFEKYFVTTKWMWAYKQMPDPRGGEQLLSYNCVVTYKKEKLEHPIKIKSSSDFKEGTKIAKTTKIPIWVVTIVMPRKLISDIRQGTIEVEGEKLDMAEISNSFEVGIDEKEFKQNQDSMEKNDTNTDQGGL